MLFLWGCSGDDPSDDVPPTYVTQPTVTQPTEASSDTGLLVEDFEVVLGPELVLAAGGDALLTRELRVHTSLPTSATLHIDGPCGLRTVSFPGTATEHVLPVLGLHQDADHVIEVVLQNGSVSQTVAVGMVHTEAIDDLPPLDVLVHEPDRMEPGLLLVTPKQEQGKQWILAYDQALHVVYALRRDVDDLVLDPEGTWVAIEDRRAVQWDIFGRELRSWGGETPLRLNHEAFPLPDGGLLTLTMEEVPLQDYPTSEDLSTTADVLVNTQAVVRFDADGQVIERISMTTLVDPTRVGYLSLSVPYDWTHTNTVVPWDDNAYLVGIRHLDVVVCVNRDGSVRWMFGDPTGWTEPWASRFLAPVGDVIWPRHPHALEVHSGVFGMFDNGNFGGSPYNPPPPDYTQISRGVGFRVDETLRTVQTEWSVPYEGLFSFAMGDADLLPITGNLLLTFARVARPIMHPRIVQVHPDTPDSPALDLRIGLDVRRWTYRAEVVPSLYPEGVLERR